MPSLNKHKIVIESQLKAFLTIAKPKRKHFIAFNRQLEPALPNTKSAIALNCFLYVGHDIYAGYIFPIVWNKT